MKKILQIMPVPDGISIGDMTFRVKDNEAYIEAGTIGQGHDSRCCLLALVEDDGGYQCVVPLVWDYDIEAFVLYDNEYDPNYHIAAVSDKYLEYCSWEDVFRYVKYHSDNKGGHE